MSTLQAEENHLVAVAEDVSTSRTHANLFDISWDDVLIPMVARDLSLEDLFTLRCCSRTAMRFVEAALEKRKVINISGNNSRSMELAFVVIGKFCRRLEVLHLARCHWLKDELLLPLLAENTRLRVVNLNDCMSITPLALQPVIIQCKDLRVLKLSKCQWLTTGAVDALTLHHSKLEEFDISYCDAIGERCLLIFFRKLNNLTVLSLAHTQSVTDQVLIQIAIYCQDLEHINLVGCSAISDYGIQALGTGCSQLKSLMVHRCTRVTERVLAPLRGYVHIDRPHQSYNLPGPVNHLYLQHEVKWTDSLLPSLKQHKQHIRPYQVVVIEAQTVKLAELWAALFLKCISVDQI